MSRALPPLLPVLYEPAVRAALVEDLGLAGDLTTDAVVPAGLAAGGRLVARASGRLAGLDVAAAAFTLLDAAARVDAVAADGAQIDAGTVLAEVHGSARALLTAERTALNFLCRLSGIATATCTIVEAVAGHKARVVCTRKTTPGLRALEKYAVRAGGGSNHRFGLDDAVLIKDNHRVIAGGVGAAVTRARAHVGHLVKIQAEVESLGDVDEALAAGADALLLDNMNVEDLRDAVVHVGGRVPTEASGGITPQTAAGVAATGVDLLSVGWLTHSAPALDIAFDLDTTTGA